MDLVPLVREMRLRMNTREVVMGGSGGDDQI